MFSMIAAHRYRQAMASLGAGDIDAVLASFAPDARLRFVGDSALGADVRDAALVRAWFERFARLVPTPTFTIERLVVGGPPWSQRVAAQVTLRATVAGELYENDFAQFLHLSWGRVREDFIVEDTARWDVACRRLQDAGVAEASAPQVA